MNGQATRSFAIDVVRRLRAAGHQAVWAGGCVRDQLLDKPPKDYDVATSAVPDQVREVFGASRTWAVGEAFGVIVVRGPRGGGQIEVATFRVDGGYRDGRRPESVRFSSAKEDARRRDFTINGMFYDPLTQTVIDHVHGQEDLRHGIVRAIGDPHARFDEDKLRMLRAVRFAAHLGFELESETLAAIQSRADEIHVVSGERIGIEMTRMLTDPNACSALEWLHRSGLLAEVFPESVHGLSRDDEPVRRALAALVPRRSQSSIGASLPEVLSLLLREWGGDPTEANRLHSRHSKAQSAVQQIADRWKLANKERSHAEWILDHESVIFQAQQLPWPRVQRVLTHSDIGSLLSVAEAVAVGIGSIGASENVAFCRQIIASDPADWNPPPLVTGETLREVGIPPGPDYKRILIAVRDAQLDGLIHDSGQARALIAKLVASE